MAAAMALAGLFVAWPLSARQPTPTYGAWGVDLTAIDASVKPGDDFDRWANGAWRDRTEIPDGRGRYGAFDALILLSETRMRTLAEDAAAGRLTGPDAQRVGAAWTAFMDEVGIEARGMAPIQPELDAIRAARSRDDIVELMGRSNSQGYISLFNLMVFADQGRPTGPRLCVDGGMHNLYSLRCVLLTGCTAERGPYEEHIARMLTLAGWRDAPRRARAVAEFEAQVLAAAVVGDRDGTPMTGADLRAIAPNLAWDRLFAGAGVTPPTELTVSGRNGVPVMATIFSRTDLETLKAWQAFHVVDNAALYLPAAVREAQFTFKSRSLPPGALPPPRWKSGLNHLSAEFGGSSGRLYVARHLPPEARKQVLAIAEQVRAAARARIARLDWMTPATRVKAIAKIDRIELHLGESDDQTDFSTLEVRPDDPYGNRRRAKAFNWTRQVAWLNGGPRPKQDALAPQLVNGWYAVESNQIVLTAAILQPPFFDPRADAAVNYGGIGGVIGHHLITAIDDEGGRWGPDGALEPWWTDADHAAYRLRMQPLVDQYGAWEVLPGRRINGTLTAGENGADIGGLALAYDAYRLSLGGKPAPALDGYSGDQRLFMAWAQVWRAKATERSLLGTLNTDPHAPPMARAGLPPRNLDAWYPAFGVKEGDRLYLAPEERVRIW